MGRGALVLVGFAGAFRRSEIAAMQIGDLTFHRDGVTIDVRASKTDQEGVGRKVGLPFGAHSNTCPVLALRRWLRTAKITAGPLFRSIDRHGRASERGLHKDSIARLIKRASGRAGLKTDGIAGHSLRAGHVTRAAMNGVSEYLIMRQTGHRSVATLRRYIHWGELFSKNAARDLGI